MKTKAQVIILVLCFFYIQNKAQVYFNNRYDGSGNFDATNSVDTFQGKYLTIGIEGVFGSNWGLSSYLFNLDGTVYKKKTFGFAGDNLLGNNGKYIHMENQFYLCGSWIYHGYNSKAFLWRFNSNLDSVKLLEYGYPFSNNIITSFIKHSDNKIYMVGYVDDTLQTNADILLIKVDTAGNEIWKKKIGVTGIDENAVSIDTLQGNLIIAGLRIIHNTSSTDAFVMRLDTAGNIVWQKNINTNSGYSGSKAMRLKDGNILICNRLKMYDVGSFTYNRFLIQKITPNNTLLWQKTYNTPSVEADFLVAIENTEGNIVIAGQKGGTDYSVKGTVNVINQNGDSLFYKEFHNEQGSQNYFRDVIQTPDKGYCFAGFIIPVVANGGTGTQDIWLLKIDSNFCESAIPCNSNVGLAPLSFGEGLGVRMYPNPTNGDLTFVFNRDEESSLNVDIIDLTGRLLMQFDVENGRAMKTINLSDLSNGIYYYIVRDKGKLIANDKFVIIK